VFSFGDDVASPLETLLGVVGVVPLDVEGVLDKGAVLCVEGVVLGVKPGCCTVLGLDRLTVGDWVGAVGAGPEAAAPEDGDADCASTCSVRLEWPNRTAYPPSKSNASAMQSNLLLFIAVSFEPTFCCAQASSFGWRSGRSTRSAVTGLVTRSNSSSKSNETAGNCSDVIVVFSKFEFDAFSRKPPCERINFRARFSHSQGLILTAHIRLIAELTVCSCRRGARLN
jgi:hypothetical protein